jgi:hypothetical protein
MQVRGYRSYVIEALNSNPVMTTSEILQYALSKGMKRNAHRSTSLRKLRGVLLVIGDRLPDHKWRLKAEYITGKFRPVPQSEIKDVKYAGKSDDSFINAEHVIRVAKLASVLMADGDLPAGVNRDELARVTQIIQSSASFIRDSDAMSIASEISAGKIPSVLLPFVPYTELALAQYHSIPEEQRRIAEIFG